MDEKKPGPCAATFQRIISSEVQRIQTGQCKLQFDYCVGGIDRGRCIRDLREALGALQYPQGNPITLFEQSICQKSREFQWLYSCIRRNDGDEKTSWSLSKCAKPDVLTNVQCSAVVDEFHQRKACEAPSSGIWDRDSAMSYTCQEPCAAALSTAMWECQSTFLAYMSDDTHTRDQQIALFTLVADDPLMTAQPRGVCSKVSRTMIEKRVERVKTNPKCSSKYDACFGDIACRGMIRNAIAASFSPHAKRYFEGGLCEVTSYKFQELYECSQTSTEIHPEVVNPWTRRSCVRPDELGGEQCSELMSGIKTVCPGADVLSVEDASKYDCSPACASSLVSVMSQCQTSLVTVAEEKWTETDRSVFRCALPKLRGRFSRLRVTGRPDVCLQPQGAGEPGRVDWHRPVPTNIRACCLRASGADRIE